MSFPLPSLCGADPYLTRDHLLELYDDYVSMSHPSPATFSSLVNNIRHPYLTALMAAKEALLAQQTEHRIRIDELQALHQRTRAAAPVPCTLNDVGKSSGVLPSSMATPVGDAGINEIGDRGEGLQTDDTRVEQQVHELIHNSSILYVSHNRLHEREWVSWAKLNADSSWKENMRLNVFKTRQPGTVKIRVLVHNNRDRIYPIIGDNNPGAPWNDELEFWAFPNHAPFTEKFLVAYRDQSTGCIFASGDREGKMHDWQVIQQFWLPC